MKIALVLNNSYTDLKEVKGFMNKVCGELGAEPIVIGISSEELYQLETSDVDLALVHTVHNGADKGLEFAHFLLDRGIQCLLVHSYGEQRFDLSPHYPLYSVVLRGYDEKSLIQSVAADMRNGPLTLSGTVEFVINQLANAEMRVKLAEDALEPA